MPAANHAGKAIGIRGPCRLDREYRKDRLGFGRMVEPESRFGAKEAGFAIAGAAGIRLDQTVERRRGGRPVAELNLASPQAIHDQRHELAGWSRGLLMGC